MAGTEPYIKVSDSMPEHRKIANAGGDAAWLWVCSVAYASRNKTDGVIPERMLPRLSDRKQPAKLAKVLVREDLWHESGHHCPRCAQPLPGSFIIHDYLQHQRSAAKIAEISEKRAMAGSNGGSQRAANAKQFASELDDEGLDDASSKNEASYTETEEVLRTSQTDNNPVAPGEAGGGDCPRHGTEKHAACRGCGTNPRARGTAPRDGHDEEEFAAFWMAYPKKVDKGHARNSWKAAVRKDIDPKEIILAAERFAEHCRTAGVERKYIPNPATWLNGERWADENQPSDLFGAGSNSPWEN